jgi:hypothetical protein
VTVPHEYNVNGENVNIINAALAAGLYPKLLNLNANGLQTITNQQPVAMVSSDFRQLLTIASKLHQLQDQQGRIRVQLPHLLYAHAVQAPICLGDCTCTRYRTGFTLRRQPRFQGKWPSPSVTDNRSRRLPCISTAM